MAASSSSSSTSSQSFSKPTLLLFVLLFLLLSSLPFIQASDEELDLLYGIRDRLYELNSDVFISWSSANPKCVFQGIRCNSGFKVTEIELSSRNLTGSAPLDLICRFRYLERLSLGFNNLYGKISGDLNNCTELRYLDLGNNYFSGVFPDVSSMKWIREMYVNQTGLSGAFPWRSLVNMTDMVVLSVGDNLFDRSPFPIEVLGLRKLSYMYLSNCSLDGGIPLGIGNLTELTDVELSTNFLIGNIPQDFSRLVNLIQLELYDNNLTGKIPPGFGNLSSLQFLDASRNNLGGDISELRFLKNLISLQLFENSFTGVVPPEFGRFKLLVNLSLYSNMFTGDLPKELGSWAEFDFIDISENQLTGEIPPWMCKLGTMRKLLMLMNKFTGPIPETYSNCTTLIRFRVNDNMLSGNIPPGIFTLPSVTIIDLRRNRLQGSITGGISKAKSLSQILLSNNRISGEIPPHISEASSLVMIDLSSNFFTGEIPRAIGQLEHLVQLHLQNNKFSGSIPISIGSCSSLADINLANNSFSGLLPPSLGSLPTLNSLNLSTNHLSGPIPRSFSSLGLSLLDLSFNKLTGPIPSDLSIEAYNGSFDHNPGLCTLTYTTQFHHCPMPTPMSPTYRLLTALLLCALVVLTLSLLWLIRTSFRGIEEHEEHEEQDEERSLKDERWDVKSFHMLTFTEKEILNSIKPENLIGRGGSGAVYRVALSNGIDLAVKHIWHGREGRRRRRGRRMGGGGGGGKLKEFVAEVEALSCIRHVNVLKLYCSITSEDSSLLVCEYLRNGSLWDRLHGGGGGGKKMGLEWESRWEIALGAAKGLEYLHHGCSRAVIHRDVKSSNILLDEFLKPRIADFGLARSITKSQCSTKDSTHVIAGTPGYLAPEYGYTYKVNEKSDVYSFGVVLMELVTGRKPMEEEEYGEDKDIVSWVYKKCGGSSSSSSDETTIDDVIDPDIGESSKEEAARVLKISVLCTSRIPEQRPTMRIVVKMLEDINTSKLSAAKACCLDDDQKVQLKL